MKSLVSLATGIIANGGAICATALERDLETVTARCKTEGESFLTITLPAFARAFESALAKGEIVSVPFPGFRKRGGYPLFLAGLLRLVFSESGDALLEHPSIDAIIAIRQSCLFASKIFETCDDRRLQRSYREYVKCEQELEEIWYEPRTLKEYGRIAAAVFGQQLSELDRLCYSGDLVPRHGPGATSDRIRGNAKFDIQAWSLRLDAEFPVADYAIPGYSWFESISSLPLLARTDERRVRVVAVPKTASKARIIAMEPCATQYAQQAVLREFARLFSGSAPCVDLHDQATNRRKAQMGSLDGSLSTLDLSEASDRVTLQLVQAVFARFPSLLACLTASRTEQAELPWGEVISLTKFASMGSATCFPVESIVFAVVALAGMQRAVNATSRPALSFRECVESTSVFGDDIIVPTCYVQDVLRELALSGARPNSHKSFWTGRFRESCGGDYYAGASVNIVRLRARLPKAHRDDREILALISFRNQLYQAGYWQVVKSIDEWIAKLRIPMPIVESTSPVVGRSSVAFSYQVERYHRDLQSPLVRGLLVKSQTPESVSSDIGALLKCTLPGRTEAFADVNHLVRAGRPDRVHTKVGMGSPF